MAEETVYRLGLDTGDAQQKVDDLDEGLESCHDRLEAMSESSRDFGDGIAAGAGRGMDALDRMGGAAATVGSTMDALASAGAAAALNVAGGMDDAAKSAGMAEKAIGDAEAAVDNLGKKGEQTGGHVRQAFDNAAAASDRLGVSFAKNFNKAEADGKSFAASVKTGIVGTFDTATKKAGAFADKTVGGIKKVGNAFLHPINTIKGKFSSAMKDAAKDVDEVGDEAKKSEKELDSMGKAGGSAGDKLSKGLGAALKVIGAIAAAAVVFTGIAKFTTAALDASKAAGIVSYSFEQTFGDAAPDTAKWAENFAGAVRRSETEVKSFLSSNKQLYEGLGITGEAATDLSKAPSSFAYDIGNKFGVADAYALSQLQDAITGNDKALADYGVRLDEAALKQSAANMGIKGSLEDLDEATLAQIRFNSILEQTEGIQQSATQSLGGFTGGVKALKAGFTDFLEKAGDKLAPSFDKIFGVILDAWPRVEPALLSFVELLAGGLEQSAPLIADFSANLLPQMLDLFGDFAPLLSQLGGELLPVLAQAFGTVIESSGPLIPLIGTLITTASPLLSLFGQLVEKLLPPLANLLGSLSPIIEALSPVLEVAAAGIGLVADVIAGLIGWLTKAIDKIGEFAQGLKDTPIGQFVSGVGEGISKAASNVQSFFSGNPDANASGTDDFEGGWTRIHEAGDEMIQAKHSGGFAYLPRGSAVIPASRTDEILSDNRPQPTVEQAMRQQPDPNWIPIVLEGNPALNRSTDTEEPDDGGKPEDPRGSRGETPPSPEEPLPPETPPKTSGETVTRKIIELHITVSSPDGSVPPEMLEEIRRMARQEAEAAIQEDKDDELNNLVIQEGYAAG